jgi:hypothetical protein
MGRPGGFQRCATATARVLLHPGVSDLSRGCPRKDEFIGRLPVGSANMRIHAGPPVEQERSSIHARGRRRRFGFIAGPFRRSGPPARRHIEIAARVAAVLVGAIGVTFSVNAGGSGSSWIAFIIGHTGGLLMAAFVVALSTKSIKELGDPVPSARTSVPVAKFTVGEKCLVYVGALTLQFFVLYLASLTTGHGFSYLEFWNIFQQRFTKGGDNPHYLYLAEHGYQSSGAKANLIVFYPLYPSLIWLFEHFCGSYVMAGRSRAALAALLLALYPFSFFSMGVYTESLFLLLSTQCLLRIEKRQWIAVGVLGCLASLCRTQGILLLLPAVYAWLRARKERSRVTKVCSCCSSPRVLAVTCC